MKNINKLNKKLQKINSKQINFSNPENISILDFVKYKLNILKQNKIAKQLKKCMLLEKEANLVYNVNVKSWFNNQNINCRQYCKFEQKAEYQKNKILYKIGVIKKKPTPPILQNIKQILPENNFFKNVHNKINSFKSFTFSKKFNKFAVNTAKMMIKGYRCVYPHYTSMKKLFASKKMLNYFKTVVAEATQELNSENITKNQEKSFRESIKFTPNPNQSLNQSTPPIKKISRVAHNKSFEYTL